MFTQLKFGLLISTIYQVILIAVTLVFLFHNQSVVESNTIKGIWGAWDADHYVHISEHGYITEGDPANFIVFFPLYPVLIKTLTFITRNSYASAIILSSILSIVGHALFYVVLRSLRFSFAQSLRVMLLLFVSPVSVYFLHVYTESLFLFLMSLALLLLIKNKYGLSSLTGLFLSLTRLVGITFIVPFIIEVVIDIWKKKTSVFSTLYSLIIPIGFLIYLGINLIVFSNPFHYQEVLRDHWYKDTVNPITQYISHAKQIIETQGSDYSTYHFDLLSPLLFPVFVLLYLLVRYTTKHDENHRIAHIPFSWVMWSISLWIVVCSQSFWLSNFRYILLILPLYPMLERITWIFKPVYVGTIVLFGLMALQSIHLFTQGAWLY